MLIWTSDEGLAVLRHQGIIICEQYFLLCSCSIAQCIILMAWDAASQLFVPCALVTGKSEYFYCKFTHNVFILFNFYWMLRCCIVDFTIGLLNSVKYQFTKSIIAG
ncbi:LOW QUALITY PROTEIN: hypothetical protein MXB_97 [Myxobolus squamalis]|nr:LOW QUALITY PROTEIN: hypothetical protein MXB_97 [Myxobolus squamalis]